MTVKVGDKSFANLKEAQDYMNELKKDPNYVPPVKEELTQDDKIDLAAQVDSLTDEDPELAEELDAALDEDADMKDGNEVPDELSEFLDKEEVSLESEVE